MVITHYIVYRSIPVQFFANIKSMKYERVVSGQTHTFCFLYKKIITYRKMTTHFIDNAKEVNFNVELVYQVFLFCFLNFLHAIRLHMVSISFPVAVTCSSETLYDVS